MKVTVISWEDYKEIVKEVFRQMSYEEFRAALMTDKEGGTVDTQEMIYLQNTFDLIQGDPDLVEKECLVLREMQRTKDAIDTKKE